jgi:uracil-DNA glycosylase family protein
MTERPREALPQKEEIDSCRRCDLWERATQGVGGEGSRKARLMLVGEQPGDEEDQQGKPFVGPAGKLLRRLLGEAGIAPADFYLTNAVKHFSWEPRGKRRIHKTPTQRQMAACNEWLEREIEAVRPRVIVALGATALRAVTRARITIAAARESEILHPSGARIFATYHPSAVLRAPDDDARAKLMRALVDDLERAATMARRGAN